MALGEVRYREFLSDARHAAPKSAATLMPDDDKTGGHRAPWSSRMERGRRDYGSNPVVVGQTMLIHGQPYTIVGVASRSYSGMVPMVSAAMWMPMVVRRRREPGGTISVVPSPTGNRATNAAARAGCSRKDV
mgnify:CR=1 FL=1